MRRAITDFIAPSSQSKQGSSAALVGIDQQPHKKTDWSSYDRHSRVSGNPVSRVCGTHESRTEETSQADGFVTHALAIARRWIPACAGMTPVLNVLGKIQDSARHIIGPALCARYRSQLDPRFRGDDDGGCGFAYGEARRCGFTLVELSIVLVIIGLIIGGVLTGPQIIQNARIANAINGLQAYQAQFQTYAQNYGAVAGDDAGAKGRFSASVLSLGTATVIGNGDGVIDAAEKSD